MPGHSHEAVDGSVPPQSNIELLPEKEILDFKPTSRPEQIGDKGPKQLKECVASCRMML
jgi:hypothetical protein